jgi:hypothetical protein
MAGVQGIIATVIDVLFIIVLLVLILLLVVVVVVVVEVIIYIYTYMHTEVNCYRKSCTSVSNARYLVCLLPSLKTVEDALLGLVNAVHLDTVLFPGQ